MNDNFTNVKSLCYWVQHVLPLVYDDSLSYMELLGRVTKRLNELIENNNKLPDYIMELIKEYISSGEIEKVLAEVLANYMLNVKFPPAGLTPATGDGSADDTEAIQGCIDYAFNNGGMSVYFPSGSYLTQPLTLRNKATLFGQDRYTTRLIMKGGATTAMFTGDVDELTLIGLGFDGNMDIQVNNVNLFTISVNSAIISNCLLTDGYDLLNITVNNDIQLNNLLFRHAVENALVLKGNGLVQGENLIFKSVSTLVGKNFVVMDVSKSILEQVKCYGASPNGVLINGNNNIVKMWNEQSLTPFVDNGVNNSVTVYAELEIEKLTGSKTAIIGGNVTETITGNKGVSAHDITETANGMRTENTIGNRNETTGGDFIKNIKGNATETVNGIITENSVSKNETITGDKNVKSSNSTENVDGDKTVNAGDISNNAENITNNITKDLTEQINGNRNITVKGNSIENMKESAEIIELLKTITAKQVFIDSTIKYSLPENFHWNQKGIKIIDTNNKPYYLSVIDSVSEFLCINIVDNGCVGDGVTDNTAALNDCILLAQSLKIPVYSPTGLYKVNSFDPFGNEVQFLGDGKFNLNGFIFSLAYRNDGEHNFTRKYFFINNTSIDETIPYYEPGDNTPYTYMCNYQGGMNGGDNAGEPSRTGYAPFYISSHNNGKGDVECLHLNASANTAGETDKYYIPAAVFINGDIQATKNDVYLNPFEFNMMDNGNDNVACIGWVGNFYRNGIGQGEYRKFIGMRLQNTGNNLLDSAFQAVGGAVNNKWNIIFDGTRSAKTENVVAMVNGQSLRWGYSPEGFYTSPGYTNDIVINVTEDGNFLQLINDDNTIILSKTFTTVNSSSLYTKITAPQEDNMYTLGDPNHRWKDIYSVNSEINVSDERMKQDINPIDEKIFEAWEKVNYKIFRFKEAFKEKGNKARYHIGVIAQELIAAFESVGLNAFDYGLICYDKECEELIDEYVLDEAEVYDGTVCVKEAKYKKITKTIKHEDVYSVRYTECLALECAYLRRCLNGNK